MIRFCCVLMVLLLAGKAMADNVKITEPKWENSELNGANSQLTLKFTVTWDHSWRDDYNYDAVYVFFKYRKKQESAEADVKQIWNHLYLLNNGATVSEGYDYWLSPLSDSLGNKNVGIFVFRKDKGAGRDSIEVAVKWDIKQQEEPLMINDFSAGRVLVSAQALEMVYIPRGPFRIGDNFSNKTFRRAYFPLDRQYDLVDLSNEKIRISANSPTDLNSSYGPEAAADRINDNTADASSAWMPDSETKDWYWQIDFGEDKTIRYFAVNGSKGYTGWEVDSFYLKARRSQDEPLEILWRGAGKDNWYISDDCYLAQKALKIENPKPYRYYSIWVNKMKRGSYPVAKTIAMTEQELDTLVDRTVLIDGPTTKLDTLMGLGARDGGNWMNQTMPETYPNGYKGFYVMKYEISQEQYARYLNKLTYEQQKDILGDEIVNKLDMLQENEYVFGSTSTINSRNSVMLTTKQGGGHPAVFANNMDLADGPAQEADGQNIACNYMNIRDMMAYADWSGLRPLTEMEYEKMSRRLYPYLPEAGEFAWGGTQITKAGSLERSGEATERPGVGNANFGSGLEGPVRVGAFSTDETSREQAGASWWGVMDLSGNLSEIYYNANNRTNIQLYAKGDYFQGNRHYTAHGDGYLVSNQGRYDGLKGTKRWSENPADFALRGGSFASDTAELRVSDRTWNTGYFRSVMQRDSTVTFRLGHSVPEPKAIRSYLILDNELDTRTGIVADTICNGVTSYTIFGSKPETNDYYTYIWYMKEDKGSWRVLEGENEQDLTYNFFVNNTAAFKTYEFSRRVATPYTDAEPDYNNIVRLVVDQLTTSGINQLKDTIYADGAEGHAGKAFYLWVSRPTTFDLRWMLENGKSVQLTPTIVEENGTPASGTMAYLHYVPERKHFTDPMKKDSIRLGNQHLRLTRRTKGVAKCPTVYDLEVYVQDFKVNIDAANSNEVVCGDYMRDPRDNQVYKTTKIGKQCWMAQNLNWNGAGTEDSRAIGSIFGRFYTFNEANTNICPEGWRLPANADWTALIDSLGGSAKAGKAMKSPKYWQYAGNSELIGEDSKEFAALGSGYWWGASSVGGTFNVGALFWSATQYYYVQIYYNNNQANFGNTWWYPASIGSYRAPVRCMRDEVNN